MNASPCTSVIVVGCGNIGSHAVPLLASLPRVDNVALIDFDSYEPPNLGAQRIAPRDVGRAKAAVQAAVLRRMRPNLRVSAYRSRFEDLPLGLLRDSVVLACVDSRSARQAINGAALAMGIAWIDAALARDGNVRARAFLPGSACLECSWGPRDYELLEQRVPCASATAAAAPTAAPCELGSMAAGLQISLLRRLLADASAADAMRDRQWFLDIGSGKGWLGRYASNPECRCDHLPWAITTLGSGSVDMRLSDALALAHSDADPADRCLAAPGMVFIDGVRCAGCGNSRRVAGQLSRRIAERACSTCGGRMQPAAIDTRLSLSSSNTSAGERRAPLTRRGFVAGDVVALASAGRTRHFQLA